MPSTIKTAVFDLGGVLFQDGGSKIADILFDKYGYDKDLIRDVLRYEGERQRAMRGEIEDQAFWEWVENKLKEKGYHYDVDIIRKEYYDSYSIDEEVLKLAKELKKSGLRIIIFSGNMRSRVDYLENKYHFSQYFDDAVYSFDYQTSKPEERFFNEMLSHLNCQPGEAVAIDDREDNLKILNNLGLKTILYQEGQIPKLLELFKDLGIEIEYNIFREHKIL